MEGKDVREWNIDDFEDLTEQDSNSYLIKLVANCLYDHNSIQEGMNMRELVTFLQYQSRTKMLFMV